MRIVRDEVIISSGQISETSQFLISEPETDFSMILMKRVQCSPRLLARIPALPKLSICPV